MTLPSNQAHILLAILGGATLKVHRSVDGQKRAVLHHLDGADESLSLPLVEALKSKGSIQSNLKFPAATYLLTDEGLRQADELTSSRREHRT